MSIIANNNYANCVGYSLSQCYDSNIEVLDKINNDDDLLEMLKTLVLEYEQALEIVEDESTLMWPVSVEFREGVKRAKTLDELYRID